MWQWVFSFADDKLGQDTGDSVLDWADKCAYSELYIKAFMSW